MKRLALVILLLLSCSAWAQSSPPQVIDPDNTIVVAVGEARILKFAEPFKDVRMAIKDIADITPQSDHIMTITGLSPGQTTLVVQAENGRVIYTAVIAVSVSNGNLVKVYRRDVKDFIGVYCNETGCGRADLDKRLANGGRDPSEPTAVTVIQPTRDGGSVTKHYQPN